MTIVVTIVLAMLAASAVLTLIAATRGPTSADRMLAVDLLLIILSAGLAAGSVVTGRTDLLAVLLVVLGVGRVHEDVDLVPVVAVDGEKAAEEAAEAVEDHLARRVFQGDKGVVGRGAG